MANPILFTITNAGKQALSGNVTLSHVAAGTGKRAITGAETALANEVARAPVISGGVERQSNTLRFSTMMDVASQVAVYEVGLFTSTGVLFAVASTMGAVLFTISPIESFIGSFGLSLASLDSSRLAVVKAGNDSLALASMEKHLATLDPHPEYLDLSHVTNDAMPHEQYVNKTRMAALLDAVMPIGYLYFTHSDINPKPLFDALLGVDTAWRRVTGKIIVSTDSSDKFVESPRFMLGKRGATSEVIAQRPTMYKLHTTHIWERVDPNEVLYDGKHKYDGKARYQ